MRRCPRCRAVFEQNPANFYYRPSTGRYGYCLVNHCHEDYHREYRENRATRRRSAQTGRKFGIEIEFIGITRETAVDAIRAAGLRCASQQYNHRTSRQWKVVPDGSLANVGGELVSPPLRGEAGIRALKKACDALVEAGARIDRTCGLHVHHDVHELSMYSIIRLVQFWKDSQIAIDQMVAPSRRDGGGSSRWCRPIDDHVMRYVGRLREECDRAGGALTYSEVRHGGTAMSAPDTARAAQNVRDLFSSIDRYYTLNVSVYPRAGTVEVRQHQGTIDAEKINAWIEFGQAMIVAAASGSSLPDGITSAEVLLGGLAEHGLDATTVEYLNRRVARLAGDTPARRREDERRREEERAEEEASERMRAAEAEQRRRLEAEARAMDAVAPRGFSRPSNTIDVTIDYNPSATYDVGSWSPRPGTNYGELYTDADVRVAAAMTDRTIR